MDEHFDRIDLIHRLIDLFAAATLGAAMVFVGVRLGQPAFAIVAGTAGFTLALSGLRRVPAGTGCFAPAALPLIGEAEQESSPHDLQQEGELLLEEQAPASISDEEEKGAVIRLVRFPARPGTSSPTEMQERIARHFAARRQVAGEVAAEADASAALRDALRDLKRALG